MECYEISTIWSHHYITYDPLLDEVLECPAKFKLRSKKDKFFARCGDYLKLDKKNIWLQFHYENFARCRLVAYIEDDFFKIWSIISTPKRAGIATRTLEFINEKIKEMGCNLDLYVVDVWPVAQEFWKKMKKRNLIMDFENYEK
ncbi:MAG: hypothetical protein EU532_01620 [Promethearchaeota archaeon]|nr:MAG: hypothetical protein EU532_01620 [Candidatus Lokiarchaeota archaeon]